MRTASTFFALPRLLLGGLLLSLALAAPAMATGPMIDWDPAYLWQTGGTFNNLPLGGELQMVGIISHFDNPLGGLDANDPSKEYTFYAHGLISQGTVTTGVPGLQFYTTHYIGGTIEIYQGAPPNASFAPNPPNSIVPGNFTDGTTILSGSFTGLDVQTNDFTPLRTGNIEGSLNWTGGTLYADILGAGGVPCPGLLTGGATWNPQLLFPGYLFRHAGKIDLQCAVPTKGSSWGRLKSLYR